VVDGRGAGIENSIVGSHVKAVEDGHVPKATGRATGNFLFGMDTNEVPGFPDAPAETGGPPPAGK
jgi:hypothetical protein